MLLIGGLLIFVIGLVMLMKPAWIWMLTESWKSNDGTEPSDLYIWSTRFGGVMMAAAGLIALVVSFI